MAVKELYSRLGVSETASDNDIQEAYQKLIADCDKNSERYSELAEAFDILSDIEKRAYYDIKGKKPNSKIKKRKGTQQRIKIEKIRTILNTLFLAGAVVTVILYVLFLSNKNTAPFYWSCSISLVIKISEYIIRFFA